MQNSLPEETTEKPDFILKTGTPTPEITDASKALDEAQAAYSKSMTDLTTAQTTLTTTESELLEAEAVLARLDPVKNKEQYDIQKVQVDAYKEAVNIRKREIEDAELQVTNAQAGVSTAEKKFETTDVPSTSEALGKSITSPSSLLSQPDVYGLEVKDNQLIDSGTGQVVDAATLLVKQAQSAGKAADPKVKKSGSLSAGFIS